jgi:hypothetical protein
MDVQALLILVALVALAIGARYGVDLATAPTGRRPPGPVDDGKQRLNCDAFLQRPCLGPVVMPTSVLVSDDNSGVGDGRGT